MFFARIATNAAWQMLWVAVGWQMYALTHSAIALGLIGLAGFVPVVLFVFVVGHVADRYDRRTVVRCCLGGAALSMATLAGATAYGFVTPALLYGMLVLLGTARAFEQPSSAALLPNIVPLKLVARGAARQASAQQTSTIVAPALGGFLYAVHPALPYTVGGFAFATAGVLYSFMRVLGARAPRPPATLNSMFEGLRFIRRTPLILGAISLDLFAVLLGGATALLPIFARDILTIGPWGLGLLRSAPAVGALSTSLFIGRHPIRAHAGRIMFAAVTVFGGATIVFGLSRWFALSFAALVVLGAADVISVVIRSALVLVRTPDAIRGRVGAVNSLFIGTSNQLGEFESGMVAALLGPVGSVVLGGIGSVLVALTWRRLFPALAAYDAGQQPPPG